MRSASESCVTGKRKDCAYKRKRKFVIIAERIWPINVSGIMVDSSLWSSIRRLLKLKGVKMRFMIRTASALHAASKYSRLRDTADLPVVVHLHALHALATDLARHRETLATSVRTLPVTSCLTINSLLRAYNSQLSRSHAQQTCLLPMSK